jgi:uncharacterized protein with HEPN domain
MRDERERLVDILEAIEKIEKYASQGKDEFERNELVQMWIVHHLQIIGEAASRLSGDFKEAHPDVAWKQIIGMRNILVHGYFEIDLEIVWAVVEDHLPELKRRMSDILGSA